MADIFIVWDSSTCLEKIIREFGLSVMTVHPNMLAAPHLSKPKILFFPTGFAAPQYCSVYTLIQKKMPYIETFVKNGGILFFLSPGSGADTSDTFDFSSFGIDAVYHKKDIRLPADPDIVSTAEGMPLSDSDQNAYMYCDGCFTGENSVKSKTSQVSVFAHKKTGKGHIYCASFHEIPSCRLFLNMMCGSDIYLE